MQGADWLVAYTFEASFVITILIVIFVELILVELIPKQLAHRNPEPIWRSASPAPSGDGRHSPLL